jgi:peptidyl-prolyl cis-trans isomerase D
MLQSLSDGLKNSKVLAYAIVIVIIIPFALFGISSYLGSNIDDVVADIDGREIPMAALDDAYNQQRSSLIRQFGGQIPSQLDNPKMLRTQALNRLIDTALLQKYIEDNRLNLSDADLSANILSQKQFHKNDKFDEKLYQSQIRSQGYSVAGFENQLRNAIILDQMQNVFLSSSFIVPANLSENKNLLNQTRYLRYYTIKNQEDKSGISIDEGQIKDYYKKNKSQFNNPPAVKVEYLELDDKKIQKSIKVTDAKLKELYEEQKQDLISNEKRTAAHILIKIAKDADDNDIAEKTKQINDIKKKIDTGADFGELAKQHSEDTASAKKNGSLGIVEKGMMVKPFEDVLFEMGEGEISKPVRTQFGLHLIKLTKIKKAKQKTFEESKNDLKKEYLKAQTDSLFYEMSEQIANLSYENPTSLEAAATAIDGEIKQSDWIKKNSNDSIAKYNKVALKIFDKELISEKINSEVIEVSSNHLFVIRVLDYKKEEAKPIEEVKNIIIDILKDKEKNKQRLSNAKKIKKSLEDGVEMVELQKHYDIKINDVGYIRRDNKQEDTKIVDTLFSLPITDKIVISEPVNINKQYQLVVASSTVNIDEKNSSVGIITEADRGIQEYQLWLNNLKNNTKIKINEFQ